MLNQDQKNELEAIVDGVKAPLESKVEEIVAASGGGMFSQADVDAAVAAAVSLKQAELDGYKSGVQAAVAALQLMVA